MGASPPPRKPTKGESGPLAHVNIEIMKIVEAMRTE